MKSYEIGSGLGQPSRMEPDRVGTLVDECLGSADTLAEVLSGLELKLAPAMVLRPPETKAMENNKLPEPSCELVARLRELQTRLRYHISRVNRLTEDLRL